MLSGATSVLQNNYGVDPNYQLGRVQTWNADVQKDLTQAWVLGGGYTRTTGGNLDIVRAPNRDADRPEDRHDPGLHLSDVAGHFGAQRRQRAACSAGW